MKVKVFSYYVILIGVFFLFLAGVFYSQYKNEQSGYTDSLADAIIEGGGLISLHNRIGLRDSEQHFERKKDEALWLAVGGAVVLVVGIGLNSASSEEKSEANTRDEKRSDGNIHPRTQSSNGKTSLKDAISQNDVQAVKDLIATGIDPSKSDGPMTNLEYAELYGNAEIISILRDYASDNV